MMLVMVYMGWDVKAPAFGFAKPAIVNQAVMSVAAVLASMAVAGLFVVSRSPLAALIVLIVLILPTASGIQIQPGALTVILGFREPTVFLLALMWVPFSIWYLRARRINPPGWLAGGSNDVLATTLVSSATPKSRNEALQRQLLGGTTVIRIGVQWFLILGFLLGLQWLLASVGENDPALSARVMYASLCICPIVTTMVSFAAIRRSRALWLLTDSTRSEFFACIERILMRLNLVMALVVAIWLAALWGLQGWRPGSAEDQLAVALFHIASLWLLGTFAIYSQLAGWPRLPVGAIAACTLAFVWWVSTTPATSLRDVAVTGLAATGLLVTAMTTMIALRWHAQRSWCEGDFPRAVTSTASGT